MNQSKSNQFFTNQGKTFFQINEDLKKLSKDHASSWVIRLIFGLLLLLSGLVSFYYSRLPQKIPLFYSRPWGQDQLVDKHYFFILVGILIVFSLLNLIIASRQRTKNPVLSQIFIWSTIIICLMGFIDILKILSILSVW
jgi:hypothetical protein